MIIQQHGIAMYSHKHMITELKVATTKVWQRSGLSRSADQQSCGKTHRSDDRVVQHVGTIGPENGPREWIIS